MNVLGGHTYNPTITERHRSLIETAKLIGTIFLLAGLFDVGRAYFSYLALKDAAHKAAEFAALHLAWQTRADHADPDNVVFQAKSALPAEGPLEADSARVQIRILDSGAPRRIAVTVTADYLLLTPLVDIVTGHRAIPLSATVSVPIQVSAPE